MLFSIYMEIYIYGYIYICIDPFHWIKTFTLLFIPFNHSQQSVIDKYHYLNDLNITQKSLFYSEQNKFSHRFKDLSGVTQLLVVGLRFDPVSFTSGLNPYYKIPWWHETIFMFSKAFSHFQSIFPCWCGPPGLYVGEPGAALQPRCRYGSQAHRVYTTWIRITWLENNEDWNLVFLF